MVKCELISVVEDDQPFRESMRKLMMSLGYAVEAFASAADFLASPCLAVTACLISDVQMPGMTGLEALPQLRELCPDATVVIFSVLGPDSDVALADGWVEKGAPLEILSAAIG